MKRYTVRTPLIFWIIWHMSQLSLEQLMLQVQQQDQAAFQALYDQTINQVYKIAMAILRQVSDAEDVACDIYTKLWQQPQAYSENKGSVLGWLSVITRNRCLDILRKKQNQKKLRDALNQERTDVHSEPTPLDTLSTFEQHGQLYEAMSQLSEVQQQVIKLSYFKGLTHAEISTLLNTPLGTIKSHARRAIQALQQLLPNEDSHELT